MSNKEIIRAYEEACKTLKKNINEENKQKFIIVFKELEVQLSRSFDVKMEQLSYTAKNVREEIARIDVILNLISNRREFRNRMINDYVKYIGYEPVMLEEINALNDEADYVAYRTNLIIANEIILDLLSSGKKLNSLKKAYAKKPKNMAEIEKEIKILQESRKEKLEELKNSENVLEDLYNYCLTAPFNEENAYIEYILIKVNPKSKLKINLNDNKRDVKRRSGSSKTIVDVMPNIIKIGSVRPTGILNRMETAIKEHSDINLPTNGLIDNTKEIEIDVNSIKWFILWTLQLSL